MVSNVSTSPKIEGEVRIVRDLFGENRVLLVTAAVLAAVSTAGTLAVPLFVKYIVSSFTHGENVLLPIVLIIVSALVAASTSAGSAYLLARIGESVILRLRGRVMSHTLKLPLKSVSGSGVGNLVSRITSDATLLRAVIDVGIVQLPLAIITIGFTVVVMAILDWVLVLVTVGSFALAGGAIWLVLRRVRANVMEQQSAIGKLADAFTSYLMSLTTVKSYQVEDRISRRLTGQAGDLMKVSVVGARLQSTIAPVMTLGQQVALVAVVIGGGARITAGALSLGDFAAFIMYLLQLVAPITMAATGIGRLQAGLAARNRFNELLSMPTEAGEASDVGTPRGCDAVDAAIAFKNVTFGHRSDDSALNGVSFAIPRRGVTAMVGPSGAGKTTALMLIERFVEAREGTVEVMGRDVIDWSLDELRGKIAYVDQTFTSIVGTVRENLQLGMSRQCDDEELWRALEKVCMKEEIAALPEALDTELGHESDLSGGQKQRIALARALLAEREVILLDEPSSQLDSTNERNLRKVISEIGETRPVVVVAHRLSTIRSATHVVMLEGGGVAGSGNHDVLMSSCAEYNRMISNDYTGSDVDEIAVGAG